MIDGLSLANAGLFKPATSEEVANQAAKTAQAESEVVVKKINESEDTKLKPDEKSKDDESNYEGRDSDNSDDSEQSQEEQKYLEKKDTIKKYKVTFNQTTDMVELVDQSMGIVIETISPDDLVNILSKSKNASGILVDKEV